MTDNDTGRNPEFVALFYAVLYTGNHASIEGTPVPRDESVQRIAAAGGETA